MNDDNSDTLSVGSVVKWGLAGSTLLVAMIIVPMIIIAAVQPVLLGFEREAFKESFQYVEGKESMLLQWIAEYDDLDVDALKYEELGKDKIVKGLRSQQESLLARVKTEAARIPPGATVSPTIKHFLEKHP